MDIIKLLVALVISMAIVMFSLLIVLLIECSPILGVVIFALVSLTFIIYCMLSWF